jgi:hypothetical protein
MDKNQKITAIEALKGVVSFLEKEQESTLEPEDTTVENLNAGEYAIFRNSPYGDEMGLLIVSGRSFYIEKDYGHAVNLATGCGSFNKRTKVRKATREEAFAAASKWRK